MVYAYKVTRKEDPENQTGLQLVRVPKDVKPEEIEAVEKEMRQHWATIEKIGTFDAFAGWGEVLAVNSLEEAKNLMGQIMSFVEQHKKEGLPEGVPVGAVAGNA